jgi:hypothetical protein
MISQKKNYQVMDSERTKLDLKKNRVLDEKVKIDNPNSAFRIQLIIPPGSEISRFS